MSGSPGAAGSPNAFVFARRPGEAPEIQSVLPPPTVFERTITVGAHSQLTIEAGSVALRASAGQGSGECRPLLLAEGGQETILDQVFIFRANDEPLPIALDGGGDVPAGTHTIRVAGNDTTSQPLRLEEAWISAISTPTG